MTVVTLPVAEDVFESIVDLYNVGKPDENGWILISDEILDTRRWVSENQHIFEGPDGKFYVL